MATVLLVTDRHSVRNVLRPALKDAGYEVTTCVGPQPSSYLCLGSRCGWCPLAKRADVVVFDSDVAGDRVGGGTTANDLIRLYGRMDRPLVVLADAVCSTQWKGDRDVEVLGSAAGPQAVLDATARAIAGHRRVQSAASEPEELAGPKRWIEGTTVSVAEL